MQTLSYGDHYDVYVSAVYSPVGIVASLIFMSLIAAHKESRAFPGSLILTVSGAQALLLMQGYFGDLGTAFEFDGLQLAGRTHPLSIEVTFLLSLVQAVFQLAYLFAIIFVFSSATRPRERGSYFWGVPALVVGVVFFCNAVVNLEEESGKEGAGFARNAMVLEMDFALLTLALGAWALGVLKVYIETRKRRVGVRDDFLSFYSNYTTAMLVFTAIQLLSYLCIIWAGPCEGPIATLNQTCFGWLGVAKVGLNMRPLFPLFALFAKLHDPLTKKLLAINIKEVELMQSGLPLSSQQPQTLDDSLLISKDLVGAGEIQSLQEAMARTIIMGLSEYYTTWADFYDADSDATILEKVVHVLRHDRMNNLKDPDSSVERFGLECEVTSHAAQSLLQVIKAHLILDVQKSFNINMSENVVRTPSDQTVNAALKFNFLTWDRRFQVRSLTPKEYKVLRRIAPAYASHVCANRFSFLTKLVGLFSFKYLSSGQKVRVCVLENVFLEEERFFKRRYELQGYHLDRQVLVKPQAELDRLRERRILETLMDADFVNLDGCFTLRLGDRDFLLDNLRQDVDFLRGHHLFGYSLLVGVVETADLTDEQLAHFGELASLKLAFFDFTRKHALVFGVSGYFAQVTWPQMVRGWLPLGGAADGPFAMPRTTGAFAEGFLRTFEESFGAPATPPDASP